MAWQLLVNGPGYFNSVFEVQAPGMKLGRGQDNDLILTGGLVSRHHATLSLQDDALYIEDLGSRNGTTVDGRTIRGRHRLAAGMSVGIGENALLVSRVANEPTDRITGQLREHPIDLEKALVVTRNARQSDVLKALSDDFTPPPVAANALDYDRLVLLFRTAELLSTAKSLDEFLEKTVERVIRHLGADTAVVMVKTERGELEPRALRHAESLAEGEVPVSRTVINEALDRGVSVAVLDARAEGRFAKRGSVARYQIGQVVCVPLDVAGESMGLLYLNWKLTNLEPAGRLESVLDQCNAFGHLIAIALEKFLLRSILPRLERLRETVERSGPASTGSESEGKLEPKAVTVLVAELDGLPSMMERAPDADVDGTLADFRRRISNVVLSFGGGLDQFCGPTAVAVFGHRRPTHASDAIQAALAFQTQWNRSSSRLPMAERCQVRLGISTGEALVADTGVEGSGRLVVAGTPQRLAAVLCSQALPGHPRLTSAVLKAMEGKPLARGVGQVRVGGQVVDTYELENDIDESGTITSSKTDTLRD